MIYLIIYLSLGIIAGLANTLIGFARHKDAFSLVPKKKLAVIVTVGIFSYMVLWPLGIAEYFIK